jgi:hypothetical protein
MKGIAGDMQQWDRITVLQVLVNYMVQVNMDHLPVTIWALDQMLCGHQLARLPASTIPALYQVIGCY